MSTLDPRSPGGTARVDLTPTARRAVVAIAAAAGLLGILSEQPVLAVAWRVGAVAAIGLGAIYVVERTTGRMRGPSARNARGGRR